MEGGDGSDDGGTVDRMSSQQSGLTDDATNETHKERVDRELLELLNELRVALPGVQILFAFLLIVPFQQTMAQTTDFQRNLYFFTLIAVSVATGLLIAPAAQHRVLFRQHDKEALLHRSSRSAYAGVLVLGVAITSAVLLVVDMVFSSSQAWVAAGAVAALLLWWWVVVPFWQRSHNR
jgi:hypothetical protein